MATNFDSSLQPINRKMEKTNDCRYKVPSVINCSLHCPDIFALPELKELQNHSGGRGPSEGSSPVPDSKQSQQGIQTIPCCLGDMTNQILKISMDEDLPLRKAATSYHIQEMPDISLFCPPILPKGPAMIHGRMPATQAIPLQLSYSSDNSKIIFRSSLPLIALYTHNLHGKKKVYLADFKWANMCET